MDLDPVVNKCPVTGIAYHFEIKILFMGLFWPHPLVGKGGEGTGGRYHLLKILPYFTFTFAQAK